MNEFLELVGTLAAAGWIYLCAVVAIALGLLVFDRARKPRQAELIDPAGVPPQETRRAA